jgi:hypothetical protein
VQCTRLRQNLMTDPLNVPMLVVSRRGSAVRGFMLVAFGLTLRPRGARAAARRGRGVGGRGNAARNSCLEPSCVI